jgi:hypothetical protein
MSPFDVAAAPLVVIPQRSEGICCCPSSSTRHKPTGAPSIAQFCDGWDVCAQPELFAIPVAVAFASWLSSFAEGGGSASVALALLSLVFRISVGFRPAKYPHQELGLQPRVF